MKKRVISCVLAGILAMSCLAGCGSSKETKSDSGEVTELNYWTWFPSSDQMEETIAAFEKANPDIKVKMTVMESTTYQEKVPLALSTEEDIDIIGVQPSEFATGVQDYLVDLDELMPKVVGEDWLDGYSQDAIKKGNSLTDGNFKFITILNSGSVMGFYNAALLKELGKEVPTTIEEYKDVADTLHEKYPDKLAGVFGGMEGWIVDELMLTVLSQQSDYYNKWIYDGASMDSQEYVDALDGFNQFFKEGIFTKDVMDLDYASATESFVNGDALVYYMGSWEAPLLSSKLREKNGIDMEDVGAMALPVVKEGGKLTMRSYLDCGIGIVESSEKQEAAAKFLAFCSTGDGVSLLAKQFAGIPNMENFEMDPEMLTTDAAREGWDTMLELMRTSTSDRKNESSFSSAVEGPCVQAVINGTMTSKQAVEKMEKEWTSGNY